MPLTSSPHAASPKVVAQLNIATMKYAIDDPAMADFNNNLERINALADTAPGFIWRLQTEEGNATDVLPLGAHTLVNLSVWKDVAALQHYVYQTAHVEIMRRRKEWFDRMQQAHLVLWHIPADHRPTVEEAIARLEHLRTHGPSDYAFNFQHVF